MIIIFALASMVLVLGRSMRVEAMASANSVAAIQAAEIERGAERYLLALAATEKDAVFEMGEEYFAAVPVGDGFFWVLRPDYGDENLQRFGLVDEHGKVDVNSVHLVGLLYSVREWFVNYLDVPDDVAGPIIDWRDTDDEPVEFGAEAESYRDYLPRNDRFDHVEELLLVSGMTNTILYGDGSAAPLGSQDTTRINSRVDGRAAALGLENYLSVYATTQNKSADDDEDNDDERRLDINTGSGREAIKGLIRNTFDADRADEIVNEFPRTDTGNIFAFWQRTKFKENDAEFDQIADNLRAGSQTVPRRINVNTAPREVLASLIGVGGATNAGRFDENDLETLLDARSNYLQSADPPGGIAWVYRALPQKAGPLAEYITGKSTRYSADILAVSGNGRGFKRVKLVMDVSGTTPKVLYRRDVTNWGWPMDQQVLASLRAGEFRRQNGAR